MVRLIITTLVCLYVVSCTSNKQPDSRNIQAKLPLFYNFNIGVDIVSPFNGLESRFLIINSGTDFYDQQIDSIVHLQQARPYFLYSIAYNRSSSQQKRNENSFQTGDTIFTKLSLSQLDTIYSLTLDLFDITKETNTDSIPPPPSGDHNNAMVTLDHNFRGDLYSTHVKDISKGSFTKLYNYLSSKKNSR